MELPLPPPGCSIVIVGLLPDNNCCSCVLYPFGCGNIMVLQCTDDGLGMHLCICMIMPDELACFEINPNGVDGCQVAFAAREYAVGEIGSRFGGALVCLVSVSSFEHENRTVQHLYHHNHGYAVGEVIEFAANNNKNN